MVLGAAVNQLLLGEADQLAGDPVVPRLQRTGRREAPAGAAVTLGQKNMCKRMRGLKDMCKWV